MVLLSHAAPCQWGLAKIDDSHYLVNFTDASKPPRRLSRKSSGGADAYILFKHRSGFTFVAASDDVVPSSWVNDMTVPAPPEPEPEQDDLDPEEEMDEEQKLEDSQCEGGAVTPPRVEPNDAEESVVTPSTGENKSTAGASSTSAGDSAGISTGDSEVSSLKRKASSLSLTEAPPAPEDSDKDDSA